MISEPIPYINNELLLVSGTSIFGVLVITTSVILPSVISNVFVVTSAEYPSGTVNSVIVYVPTGSVNSTSAPVVSYL